MANAMPMNGRSRYHNVQLSWNCWFPTKSANDDAAWMYAPRPPAMSTIKINRCSKDAKKLMCPQNRLTRYFLGDSASLLVLACAARTFWSVASALVSGAVATAPFDSFTLPLAAESVAGATAATGCGSPAVGGGGHGAGQRVKN